MKIGLYADMYGVVFLAADGLGGTSYINTKIVFGERSTLCFNLRHYTWKYEVKTKLPIELYAITRIK